MALNAIHLLAVIDAAPDIPVKHVPTKVRQALATIRDAWQGLSEERRRRIWQWVERQAIMAQGRDDPFYGEDLSDVEDEF